MRIPGFNRPWVSQPQDARLDESHWLYRWIRQGTIATGPKAANARTHSAVTDSTSLVTAACGFANQLTGSTGRLNSASVASATPWGILTYGVLRASGASSIATIAEDPGNSTRDRSLHITGTDAANGYLYGGPTQRNATSPVAVPVNKPTLLASGADGTNVSVYLARVLTTTSTSGDSTPYGFEGYSTPEFVIGYGGGGTTVEGSETLTSNWSSAYTLLLSRALTLTELLTLEDNPWQIFEPRRIWVPVSAGAGSSFNAAWVRNRSQVIGAGVR